jgi:hypothetical protein
MNFQSILEELDRLYEEDAKKSVTDEAAEEPKDEETETLKEAVEDEAEAAEVEAIEDDAEIVDDEAEETVELQLVLACAECGALMIKAEADVAVDEETGMANMDEACQYCEATAGHNVIGTFTPNETAVEEVEEVEEEPAEEADEGEVMEERLLDLDMPITANVNVKADGNNVPFMNTGV